MPKSKEEFERIRIEARDNIINKAIEVFAKKGFSATNITDIAKAAGISNGLMYRYFSSKQELFESIAGTAIEGLSGVAFVFGSDGSPKEIIDRFCQEIIGEMNDEGFINLNMMVIQGMLYENNPIFEEILYHDKKMFEAAAKLIKRGQDENIFGSGDPMAKASLFFSSIQGLTMMKFFLGDNFLLPSVAEMTAFLYTDS